MEKYFLFALTMAEFKIPLQSYYIQKIYTTFDYKKKLKYKPDYNKYYITYQ